MSLIASVKVYSLNKQTKRVETVQSKKPKLPRTDSPTKNKGLSNSESVTTIAEKQILKATYSVNEKLNKGKQIAACIMFAKRVIGSRYAAGIAADKRVPANLYFEISIEGEVFRSSNAVAKAEWKNLITVSSRKLKDTEGNYLSTTEVISKVVEIQTKGLNGAAVQIQGIKDAAEYADSYDYNESETNAAGLLKVEANGELVTA